MRKITTLIMITKTSIIVIARTVTRTLIMRKIARKIKITEKKQLN